MNEQLLSTEAVASPERLGGYTEYEALQARLLADITDPDYRFTRPQKYDFVFVIRGFDI